ncbi:50S ribosomal protein L4 [Candidatus Woesearchaeota archaeon]|nr:50S ribosomal protein L4 [Candidatus Woesearchaeota archaeon]
MNIYNLKAEKVGSFNLPEQFSEEYHPDIIKRAVLAIQSHKRQRYGADPLAGKKTVANISKRRREYKTSYGHGISRVPRKVMWRRGRQFGWEGAFAPGTKGGRKAHPPKSEKIWDLKINLKERRKAIRSALAATFDKELVEARNHILPKNFPFVIDSDIETLNKTKDVENALGKLGLKEELMRVNEKRVRAGKGKMRGRKKISKKGPLLVVAGTCPLLKSAKNIEGVDIAVVDKLNAELLAPGAFAGRLTIYTQKAIERLEKERLFI